MKKLIASLAFLSILTAKAQSASVTLGWTLPPGNTQLVTNTVVFEGVTNTVTIYPDYAGFEIYFSPILTTNLSAFTLVTNAAPTATQQIISGLPNGGNKFLCIVTTNIIGMKSTPSNLIQIGPGNSQKVQVIAK